MLGRRSETHPVLGTGLPCTTLSNGRPLSHEGVLLMNCPPVNRGCLWLGLVATRPCCSFTLVASFVSWQKKTTTHTQGQCRNCHRVHTERFTPSCR
jgi:hypothetical protein